MVIRILIVDDDALFRRDLSETLQEMGFELFGAAGDAEKAAKLCEGEGPDVVLCDIAMPGTDGLALTERLSDRFPVVMLTAHSSSDLVDRAAAGGAMGYLLKPVRDAEIVPAVRLAVARFLERSALHEKARRLKDQLEQRKLVDKAKGCLMESRNISEREAYRMMQRFSMDRNVSLKRTAEAILAAHNRKE